MCSMLTSTYLMKKINHIKYNERNKTVVLFSRDKFSVTRGCVIPKTPPKLNKKNIIVFDCSFPSLF